MKRCSLQEKISLIKRKINRGMLIKTYLADYYNTLSTYYTRDYLHVIYTLS